MPAPNISVPSALALADVGRRDLPWWRDAGLRRLVFLQSLILAAQIVVGYDESVTGSFQSMQPWKDAMGQPSSEQLGLITASVFVGGFVGAAVAAAPADRFGRRIAFQLGLLLEVVGSILQAAAANRGHFIGGRVVLGCGISFVTTAGPNLLTELCHPRLRGKIAPSFNVLWYLGSIIASWLCFGTSHLSTQWSWRIPSIVQTVVPFLLFWSAFFVPESPRWLCSKGRLEEARAFIAKYHANGDETAAIVAIEMEEIVTALKLEQDSHQQTSWSTLLRTKANRKRMGIVLMVSFGTLWNGQGIITYYFSIMLNYVGITDPTTQTGINGGISIFNLVCSAIGVVLADKIGRRPLWLTSYIGMILLGNIPLTVASALYQQHGSRAAAYAAVVFMYLYNATFNLACNPLLYSYTPEILPYRIRSKGLAVQVLASQAALVVNQYVNPIAMDRIGYYYYVFYLGVLVLFTAVVYLTFPETRGYSLEELALLFDDARFDVRPLGSTARAGVVVVGQARPSGAASDDEPDAGKTGYDVRASGV